MAAHSLLNSKRRLVIAVTIVAALQIAHTRARRITSAQPGVAAALEGSFQLGGVHPGEPLDVRGVRAWGSWSGSDDHHGTITLGPLPSPRVLHLAISGYPNLPGNSVVAEIAGTEFRQTLALPEAGERWSLVDVELPQDWVDRPLRIVARDDAEGFRGWFGLSEPLQGFRVDGRNALLESFAGWTLNGLLLGLVFFASARWLAARSALAPHWIPLAAGAGVALCGYAGLWLYFAHAVAGLIFSWAVFAGSLVAMFACGRRGTAAAKPETTFELSHVAVLMLAVGGFYLALLHLFPSGHDFYALAANRFREDLPSDNMLPHELAEKLFNGRPVRNLGYEWLSSDRPPLQSGWELLTWPAGRLLALDSRTQSGTAALWFQLLWVTAAYGLLRELRVTPRRAAGWIATLALAGFFAQNTLYTWPKLAAGSFAIGTFACVGLRRRSDPVAERPRRELPWAGIFAALAWLAHGGVAFSFLALAPWVIRRAREGRRAWAPAAVACALLVTPWFAYQRFYEPPANRLLKWHLAGQSAIDPRGTWQTLRENYAKIGWRQAAENKLNNFHGQIYGDWRQLFEISAESRGDRRHQEFFQTARALTWWPLLALGALVACRRPRREMLRGLGALTGWIALTIAGWCLLMFESYSATIHQGSYAMMMGLFVVCSVVLDRGGRGWWWGVAALQAFTFATTWAPGNGVIHGPPNGLPFVLLGAAALGWFLVRGARETEANRGETPPGMRE